MINFIKRVKGKINSLIWSLASTGAILTILGVLIMKNDLIFRILIASFIFVIAYSFFFGAYKLWSIKKEFEKYFEKK